MHNIEIPLGKKKVGTMLLIALIFIALGTWLIIWPPTISHRILGNPTVILIIGITNIVLFGLVLILLIKMQTKRTPGLIITDKGITDNSNFLCAGFVPWDEISEIHEIKVSNRPMINIVLNNPVALIERQKSKLKRKLLATNYKMTGLIMCIPSNILKIEYQELKELLFKTFSEHKTGKDE